MVNDAPDSVARDLIQALNAKNDGPERRGAERHVVMIPATIYILDEGYNRRSGPQSVVVRDISETGVSIIVREIIVADFIEIVFRRPFPNAALFFDPIRNNLLSADCTDGFFQISGPFVVPKLPN